MIALGFLHCDPVTGKAGQAWVDPGLIHFPPGAGKGVGKRVNGVLSHVRVLFWKLCSCLSQVMKCGAKTFCSLRRGGGGSVSGASGIWKLAVDPLLMKKRLSLTHLF